MLTKISFDMNGLQIVSSPNECALVIKETTCVGRLNGENQSACGFRYGQDDFEFSAGAERNKQFINAAEHM